MEREKIARMAMDAGLKRVVRIHEDGTQDVAVPESEAVIRFAEFVAAAEREACAKIADRYHIPMCMTTADAIAHEIRARGNQ